MAVPSKHHSEIVRLCKVYNAYFIASQTADSDTSLWRQFLLDCIQTLGLDESQFNLKG